MSTINKIADGVIWTIASKFLSAAYATIWPRTILRMSGDCLVPVLPFMALSALSMR